MIRILPRPYIVFCMISIYLSFKIHTIPYHIVRSSCPMGRPSSGPLDLDCPDPTTYHPCCLCHSRKLGDARIEQRTATISEQPCKLQPVCTEWIHLLISGKIIYRELSFLFFALLPQFIQVSFPLTNNRQRAQGSSRPVGF